MTSSDEDDIQVAQYSAKRSPGIGHPEYSPLQGRRDRTSSKASDCTALSTYCQRIVNSMYLILTCERIHAALARLTTSLSASSSWVVVPAHQVTIAYSAG
jgi:hypothetical protein